MKMCHLKVGLKTNDLMLWQPADTQSTTCWDEIILLHLKLLHLHVVRIRQLILEHFCEISAYG